MAKYIVSADLQVPVLVAVEAESEADAEEKVAGMDRKELLRIADTEADAIGINIDGIDEE